MKTSNMRFLPVTLIVSIFITMNAFAQTQMTSTRMNKQGRITLLNAFNKYSNKASESFLNNNMKLASKETREALEIVKKDSLHAADEGERLLNESKIKLEKLAQDLETGASISEEKLKDVFIDARNAIIINHYYVTVQRLHRQASN